MAIKTTIFYGELQGETDLCWYVFDGNSTLKIPKSQVVNLRMLPNNVDCEMEIPTWLARKKASYDAWASRRGNVIEISGIVSTTDRCIKAVVKKTGKVANFPRRITDFAPGMAIVPLWFYRKISRSTDEASDQRS